VYRSQLDLPWTRRYSGCTGQHDRARRVGDCG
jgi:hypothetical protein